MERWTGDAVESCVIVTTRANNAPARIHDRSVSISSKSVEQSPIATVSISVTGAPGITIATSVASAPGKTAAESVRRSGVRRADALQTGGTRANRELEAASKKRIG